MTGTQKQLASSSRSRLLSSSRTRKETQNSKAQNSSDAEALSVCFGRALHFVDDRYLIPRVTVVLVSPTPLRRTGTRHRATKDRIQPVDSVTVRLPTQPPELQSLQAAR